MRTSTVRLGRGCLGQSIGGAAPGAHGWMGQAGARRVGKVPGAPGKALGMVNRPV